MIFEGGLGDLDFLTADIGGLNLGGGIPSGPPLGVPPAMGGGLDTGLLSGLTPDFFSLQTGGGAVGPAVLSKQVCDYSTICIVVSTFISSHG